MSDASEPYIDAILGEIVGLRLRVDAIEGLWKLIRHHPQANRSAAIAGLAPEDNAAAKAVATIMAGREIR